MSRVRFANSIFVVAITIGLFGVDSTFAQLKRDLSKSGSAAKEQQKVQKKQLADYRALEKELREKIPASTRRQFLKDVLPAIQRGSEQSAVAGLLPIIGKRPSDALKAIDAYCIQLGYGSILELTQRKFVESVEQGRRINTAKMKPRLKEFLMDGLLAEMDSQLDLLADHKIMDDELHPNKDWAASEKFFWEVHVWKNRLDNLVRLGQQSMAFAAPNLARARKREDLDAVKVWERPTLRAQKIQETYRDLLEREVEIRMLEIPMAESVLRERSSFEDKIHAAFQLEMHAGTLSEFFATFETPVQDPKNEHKSKAPVVNAPVKKLFQREALNDETLRQTTQDLIKSGRKHGADVIKKALLLRIGAHWWLRGRYGVAPLSGGLLKPLSALKSPQDMFGLYMPIQRPSPVGAIDESSGEVSPGHHRRHYYTWAVEKQDISIQNADMGSETSLDKTTSLKNSSYFW